MSRNNIKTLDEASDLPHSLTENCMILWILSSFSSSLSMFPEKSCLGAKVALQMYPKELDSTTWHFYRLCFHSVIFSMYWKKKISL